MPATRPCGPSARTSRVNGPSTDSPMTARVVRPRACQRRTSVCASGRCRSSTSSSRLDAGRAAARSSVDTSRIGASARASRSSQVALTTSGRIASTWRCSVVSRSIRPSAYDATVRHSSGSSRTVRSRQTKYSPTRGPSLSRETMPGLIRISRAPSSTTTQRVRPASCFSSSSRRSSSSPVSSASIVARASSSVASRTARGWSSSLRAWGSHFTQSQSRLGELPSRTATAVSAGPCRAATCATAHIATDRHASGVPATPTTPTSRSGMVTGTSGAVHSSGPSCASRAGSLIVTSEGRSVVPSRRCRKSRSQGRRSHSRARGPVANSSTVAGSG